MNYHLKAIHSYCNDCEVDLKRRDDLLDHLKEMHLVDIQCELCKKRFINEIHLDAHFKAVHTTESKRTCNICGFQATSMANLNRRPQQCNPFAKEGLEM